MGRKCLRIESLGQACLMMLAQFPRAADGDGDVRNCLAGELLKVMQNIESFRKNNYCHRFGLLYITNANTQCGQITNPPEQVCPYNSLCEMFRFHRFYLNILTRIKK